MNRVAVALFSSVAAGVFVLAIIGVRFEVMESALFDLLDLELENPVIKLLKGLASLLETAACIVLVIGILVGGYNMYFKPNKR
jgi:hypothetical protein